MGKKTLKRSLFSYFDTSDGLWYVSMIQLLSSISQVVFSGGDTQTKKKAPSKD